MTQKFTLLFTFLLGIIFQQAVVSGNWISISKDSPAPVGVQLVSSTADRSVVHFTVEGYSLNAVQTPNGTAYTVTVEKGSPLQEKGAPDLPGVTAALAIPDLADMQITVLDQQFRDYPGVEIAPSKGIITRDQDPSSIPYTYGRAYSSNAFWPASVASASEPYIIRNVRGQNISVCPFTYNPVTKILRVYTSLTIELKKISDNGKNQLTHKVLNNSESQEFSAVLQKHFLNKGILTYTPLNDYGKILVICYGPLMSEMEAYVDWKNSMGYPTKIVDVATIGTTASAIKSYILNYYNAYGVTFVLLVGDGPQIPTNVGGGLGGPSDNAYGYTAGSDHYADVFIGRFSAENAAQVHTQVQRTLDYEKNPGLLTDDWYTTVIGIASDQGPGDDGEYDYQHIRNQQTKALAYTYTMHPELFDGSQGGLDATGNPTPSMVATEVNNGSSLILYTGHGSTTSWGTSGFSNTNVNQLTNQGKLPFIWSVACVNGEFMNGTCFAEAWLRASQGGQPTGAIAFLGSTINQSWNSPMAGQDEMTDILTENVPGNIKRTFAGLSINGCMKMIDDYGTDGSNMADTWTVFGDPTLQVRTDNPTAMTVSHDPTLIVGSTTLTVNCNVDGARAAVSLNDSLLATACVNGTSVTLTFPALSNPGDSVRIVVTAYNHLPYIADIPIITASGPYVVYFDNHVNDTTGNNNHQLEFGETSFINLSMKNVGVAATSDLSVKLRTSDTYVLLTDSTENFGVIAPDAVKWVNDGFEITVPGNIPDGHVISFDVIGADGSTTWNSSFSLTAHAPALATGTVVVKDSLGNSNGRLDPGETAFLKIFVNNNGSADAANVSGELLSANPFVTVITPTVAYGSINGAAGVWKLYEISVDPAAPEGVYADFLQQITADQGIICSGTFRLIIGKIPVMITDFDGNANSGSLMETAVQNLAVSSNYAVALPANISDYKAVFVCLGVYADNHVLSTTEGQILADYLNAGGRVYMEGGDTWKYDPVTAVHPMFHITGDEDGSSDLGTISGYSGTFTSAMLFTYSGDNSYIDHISPTTGSYPVLKNESPNYVTTIAYDAGTYRTIGSSSEFGGLDDDAFPSTRDNLMQQYLDFFGVQGAPLMAAFYGYPTKIIPGDQVSFTDFSTGGVTTWNWSFPGGTPSTSTEQNPQVMYENSGVYDVQLIVSNGNSSDTLLRNDYVSVDYPLGIKPVQKTGIAIFPNPSDGMITIVTDGSSTQLEVFNSMGKILMKRNIPAGQTSITADLSSVPAGIYVLQLSGSSRIQTGKLIIK